MTKLLTGALCMAFLGCEQDCAVWSDVWIPSVISTEIDITMYAATGIPMMRDVYYPGHFVKRCARYNNDAK